VQPYAASGNGACAGCAEGMDERAAAMMMMLLLLGGVGRRAVAALLSCLLAALPLRCAGGSQCAGRARQGARAAAGGPVRCPVLSVGSGQAVSPRRDGRLRALPPRSLSGCPALGRGDAIPEPAAGMRRPRVRGGVSARVSRARSPSGALGFTV